MLAPNTLLQNRYRIVRQLAHGGMGRVYLAQDQRFRKSRVALKEARCERVDTRKAFEREAELLHRLRHPALPHVTDYFIEGSKQYLVMQFIPGMTLEDLLLERQKKGDGPFASDQVLQWASQLLDALEYLHGHHPPVIHRDIKPQNLKLTPRGEVVLLDFGLAKGAATEDSQADESVRGYTRYYAPLEQIEGNGTDPRSDLYALAATLYRLLTGTLPTDALTRASATLHGRPDPLLPANILNPRVSAVVAAALARALVQNPDERPATAREMRSILRLRNQLVRTDSTARLEQQLSDEIPAPTIEEPEIPITPFDTIPNLESTFVGQAIPTDFRHHSALQAENANTPSNKQSPWIAWTIRTFIGVLILMSTVSAYRYWNPDRVERSDRSGLTGDPPPSPAAMAEVLSCSLKLEKTRKSVSANTPLKPGEWFKLHFTTRQPGFIYIIAPDKNNVPTMFLTAQPNPGWGVKTNLIEIGDGYSFPPRSDKWLRITGDVSAESYLIIFAPTPLNSPDFLTGPAGRKLTAEEVEALRQQVGKAARTEISGDQVVVKAPANTTGKPFAFDIRAEIKRP